MTELSAIVDRLAVQDTVNELFLQMQPAHLQKLQGDRLSGEQRSVARAALFRARLSTN